MTQKNSLSGRIGSRSLTDLNNPALSVDVSGFKNEEPQTTTKHTMEEPRQRPRGGKGPIQADRLGKKHLSAWIDANAKKQFDMLGIEQDKTNTELVIEAVRDLFKKHGKPPIV